MTASRFRARRICLFACIACQRRPTRTTVTRRQRRPRARARLFRCLWIDPGPLRKSIPAYLDWFRPSFHPWQHDNRDLVAAWKAEHGESELQAAPAA